MTYRVWTDEEIKNRNVVEDGSYPFKITTITKKRTKIQLDDQGNAKPTYEMWEVDFEFHDKHGVIKKLRDWIIFCEGMDWKLRHLASTTGQIELYEAQQLAPHHLQGKPGVFLLGSKESTYNGETRKQNFVKDYVKREDQVEKSSLDDDIPHM
jgi:hypothetical protein